VPKRSGVKECAQARARGSGTELRSDPALLLAVRLLFAVLQRRASPSSNNMGVRHTSQATNWCAEVNGLEQKLLLNLIQIGKKLLSLKQSSW